VLLSRKASHEAAKERQIMVLNFHCEKAKKSLSALQKVMPSETISLFSFLKLNATIFCRDTPTL